MSDTFADVYRTVMLRCPMAPAMLARDWVKEALKRAWDSNNWSFGRCESAFSVNDQDSGTVNVTEGSDYVPGVGITFASTDLYRQFRVGSGPVYTIKCVDTDANQIQLDRVYYGQTQSAVSCTVLDAYITMPSDFGKFIVVLDPTDFFQIRHWVTEEELNAWDPQRTSTGTPWALVSRRLGSIGTIDDRVQYELWPYATSNHEYWYFYYKRPPDLADTDEIPGILGTRTDIVRTGALAEAARWPGTENRKNPYFNLQLADKLEKKFLGDLARLEVQDDDVFPTWWETVSHLDRFHPLDAKYMQAHDVG
jgi:hypothetical protein